MMHTSAQLVIDHHEVTTLGKELIASRLEEFLCALPTQRLLVWNSQGDEYFDLVAEIAHRHTVELYLWLPVLADRLDRRTPDSQDIIRSAEGEIGTSFLEDGRACKRVGRTFSLDIPAELTFNKTFNGLFRFLGATKPKGCFWIESGIHLRRTD